MDEIGIIGVGHWIELLTNIIWVLCFYFTLSFFQHLKSGEERLAKQSKIAAIICLALGLSISTIISFFLYSQMMY